MNTVEAARTQMGGTIVYFGWALNEKGQIEQVRVERMGGQGERGFAPNPHKKQTWTGRIFKTVTEAKIATVKLNLLPPDTRLQHGGR